MVITAAVYVCVFMSACMHAYVNICMHASVAESERKGFSINSLLRE